jgi:tetratricopeptide (TPR) repeat protein
MKPSEILATQARQKALPIFEQGRAQLDARNFDAATQQLQAAIAIFPQYTDALQLLGIVYAQTGKLHMAVSQFKQILKIEPNNARAYNNLGQVLDDLKDYESALASFDRAIAIDPYYGAAHSNRADTLSRIPAGTVSVTAAPSAHAPLAAPINHPKIDYMQIAIHLYERGDKNGAMVQMEEWMRKEPTNALAHLKRGILCKELRRYHDAVDSLNLAVQHNPKGHEAYYERGDVLQYHELFEMAERDFKTVIALKPNLAVGFEGLAGVQNAMGLVAEASANIKQALALNPSSTNAQKLRQDLMLDMREHDALLLEAKQRVQANPTSAVDQTKLGNLHTHLRQFDAAESAYDQALRLEPDNKAAKQGLAGLLHLQGKWDEAYKINPSANYASNTDFLKSFGKPLWTGLEDVRGKTVLIHEELGQGDTILLSRLASLVTKECGARVILQVHPNLVELIGTLENVSLVLSTRDAPPPFDFICSTLTLPAIFQLLPNKIPFSAQPYLQVKPEWLTRSPQLRLPAKTKTRVGLVWGGGHAHYNYRRSVPLEKFLPLLQMQDVEFYSFQKDRPAKDWAKLKNNNIFPKNGEYLIDIAEILKNFADTAALISQMDLLITVDTSVAHVAGALGKPVWMLSRRDHPWLEGRNDNPWYESMRMYTQTDFGNWDDVLAQVKHDLSNL